MYALSGQNLRTCPAPARRSLRAVVTTRSLHSSGGSDTDKLHVTHRKQQALQRARQYYEEVWSQGRVLLLNTIMAESHQQHDVVWQPGRVGQGRRAMKRGILAYRAAYPDLVFTVTDASYSEDSNCVYVSWSAQGTNLGPIRGQPPTHQVTAFSGISRLQFDEAGHIAASYVFRQSPADEARYFLGQAGQGAAAPGSFAAGQQPPPQLPPQPSPHLQEQAGGQGQAPMAQEP